MTMTCAFCDEEIEKDWSEYPPGPKCFGCADFEQSVMEDKYE